MKIDHKTGSLSNYDGPLHPGIYQGGSAEMLTDSLKVNGDEILYIGDHIYKDVLRIKKDCAWRTALVVEEIETEVEANIKTKSLDDLINTLMEKKFPLEESLLEIATEQRDKKDEAHRREEYESILAETTQVDEEISKTIQKRQKVFNPHWGEIMRIGNEESYFAHQVQTYACVYMSNLFDFLECSPRMYFRARRRSMAHEDL